jgi:hypothetical protein
MSFEFGKAALREIGKTPDKAIADDKPENGVAQKFKLLVVSGNDPAVALLRRLLAGEDERALVRPFVYMRLVC